MKFVVTRASSRNDKRNLRPCPGVVRDPKDKRRWWLVVETLEDLAKFVEREGKVVVGRNPDALLEIEIYDTWRED